MTKESQKSINIENLNNEGGTINFYVGEETPSGVSKKSFSIAAVDRYSSPLEAEVALSPWGESHYRVSAVLMNPMIGQRVYQKYLTYDDKSQAESVMNDIANVFAEIKDEAEVNRKHSAYLIPLCWKKLSNISDGASVKNYDVDDDSIKLRFDNNQFDSHSRDNPEPYGWVGDDSHFPDHTKGVAQNISDIVGVPSKMGSSQSGLQKVASCPSLQMSSALRYLFGQ